MKVAIGSDHAGFAYKEKIKELLKGLNHEVYDFGTHSDEAVDYPLYIRPVAEAVARNEVDRGIVLGGSGNGEAIVANKIPGIRCTLCWNKETARLAREHNDGNVLSLGARLITEQEALEIVGIWLSTPFTGGRHLRRIKQIAGIEASASETASKDKMRGSGGKANNSKQRKETKKMAPKPYDVLISFRYIKYFEGNKTFELNVDPSLKGPSIIHIPSPERWASELPKWTQGRREEILERIRQECSHLTAEWSEY
ncbi:MAG: ribose 5-phosphate isomerase B [Desulfobacterales bacterium]|nr:ribose 5-phosphate isomerase B [Desulfobacterales bacterium]